MKIAIDLDKNYLKNPEMFDRIARRFQEAGHQAGVLTARAASEGCNVGFTPDFVFFLNEGDLSYPERAESKAAKMREEGIDIIFDDRASLFPKDVVALEIV